ncbi:probable 39S ribosomal protein L49, mitochondrial [Coccinella septempunctata]|uniref:probable 39S ribosomal protein L49, mitochondrial n=1 Tax=Coccinella septempunctata TaxID=41139 RepID=UPI001D090055|nr:probable 39S ribosomal protein L49, mitochondrial [Coccinella septempunctata]
MELILRGSQTLLRTCSRNIVSNKYKQVRLNSYYSSPTIQNVQINTKYEISRSPDEWKYVERIIPPITVPNFAQKEEYHSEFKPPSGNAKDHPYFIPRTKNHMIPVYLHIQQRGMRRLTVVRKIQGDIWLLGKELETFLQPMSKKPIRMQINEFTGGIRINGDYVNAIKYWLQEKGF